MCLDWSTVQLKGTEFGSNYETVDIILLPCATREIALGGEEDRIPEDCNRDQ